MPQTDSNGLRLLSLDGGGIRGLSTLLILQTIMHRIKTEENLKDKPLPCDYFDLIGGTSTGGLIALMLGRLRMSVEEAIDCYDNLAKKVFSELNWWGSDGKYKATLLEEMMKAIVEKKTGDSEAQLLDDGHLGGICKTFVCAMNAHNMNARKPVLFRTYGSRKEVPISCTIWQAARATSATPTIFKRVFIGPASRPEPFIDGGVGRNNPTAELLAEAELMFPDMPNIACLVSIGTGKPGTIDMPNPGFFERNVVPVGVINAMLAMATDCEDTAQQMQKKFEHLPKTYFRFNVEQGLQKVKLEDWERMGEVSAHTRSYMSMHEVDQRLDAAVKAIRQRKGGIETLPIGEIPNQLQTTRGSADVDIRQKHLLDLNYSTIVATNVNQTIMSIETGQYTIENVRQKNLAYLPDPNKGTPVVASVEQQSVNERWNVDKLSNGTYTIKSVGNNMFAVAGNRPGGDVIIEGWDKSQQWVLQATREKGRFTIASTDTRLFWSLVDNQDGTPVSLSSSATDTRNFWIFKKILPST